MPSSLVFCIIVQKWDRNDQLWSLSYQEAGLMQGGDLLVLRADLHQDLGGLKPILPDNCGKGLWRVIRSVRALPECSQVFLPCCAEEHGAGNKPHKPILLLACLPANSSGSESSRKPETTLSYLFQRNFSHFLECSTWPTEPEGILAWALPGLSCCILFRGHTSAFVGVGTETAVLFPQSLP